LFEDARTNYARVEMLPRWSTRLPDRQAPAKHDNGDPSHVHGEGCGARPALRSADAGRELIAETKRARAVCLRGGSLELRLLRRSTRLVANVTALSVEEQQHAAIRDQEGAPLFVGMPAEPHVPSALRVGRSIARSRQSRPALGRLQSS